MADGVLFPGYLHAQVPKECRSTLAFGKYDNVVKSAMAEELQKA